jgi:AcrR family transcriptional regulator
MTTRATHRAYRRAPEEKRALLLSAARELFAEHGFEQTSTQQIARRAGVSEGILFHHFGSKRGLLECVAEDFMRAGARAAMPPDAEAVTEEDVVRGAFDFADAHPALYRMLAQLGAAAGDPGLTTRSEVLVQAIRKRLERGMALGRARRGDAKIMAELQLALVDGAYRAWLQSADPALREAYIAEAIRCMKAMLNDQANEERTVRTSFC